MRRPPLALALSPARRAPSARVRPLVFPPTRSLGRTTTTTTTTTTARRGVATLAAATLGVSAVIAAGGWAAAAVYASKMLNRSRARWFTDRFVLSPESLRMPFRSIALVTEDMVRLEGWYIEQTVRGKPSERVVLCCAPYYHDKSTLLAVARALWDSGHSVLLFDFRTFAPEKTGHETIGYLELRDARAALAWLRENKPPGAKIGLMGCSMGGAMALTLAEEADDDIVGVATDCAFCSLKDVVRHYVRLHVSHAALEPAADLFVETVARVNALWYGYELDAVGPEKNLHNLRVPLLVIHSANDSVVPVSQAYKIFEGAAAPREHRRLIVVPDAEHIGSFFLDEIAYSKRIVAFLDDCFDHASKRTALRSAANLAAATNAPPGTVVSEGPGDVPAANAAPSSRQSGALRAGDQPRGGRPSPPTERAQSAASSH